jgi:23S rRNA (cytidine1920-2'-O)/16S rRNA (cytidine1409-2'-O)-methyltransferase
MKSFHARTPRPPTEPDHVPAVVERKASAGTRADQVLVARGLADSRTSAQRLIAAGRVGCRGERGIEPVAKRPRGDGAAGHAERQRPLRFARRLKLAGALAHRPAVRDRVCPMSASPPAASPTACCRSVRPRGRRRCRP